MTTINREIDEIAIISSISFVCLAWANSNGFKPQACISITSRNEGCDIEQAFQEYLDNFVRQLFKFQMMFDPENILIGSGIIKNVYDVSLLSQAVED